MARANEGEESIKNVLGMLRHARLHPPKRGQQAGMGFAEFICPIETLHGIMDDIEGIHAAVRKEVISWGPTGFAD